MARMYSLSESIFAHPRSTGVPRTSAAGASMPEALAHFTSRLGSVTALRASAFATVYAAALSPPTGLRNKRDARANAHASAAVRPCATLSTTGARDGLSHSRCRVAPCCVAPLRCGVRLSPASTGVNPVCRAAAPPSAAPLTGVSSSIRIGDAATDPPLLASDGVDTAARLAVPPPLSTDALA
eukprot:1795909-Pleurochrysis_carterae.AAC.2